MSDGYMDISEMTFDDENIKQKFMHIATLRDKQSNIDKEIGGLSKEIEHLPKFPRNLDRWINSFSSDFKMSDFKKIFEINKKYRHLVSEREANQREIKIFIIDGLLEQIKEIDEK